MLKSFLQKGNTEKQNNSRRGFTLIELIVAIAIIAIASVLIISFTADSSSQVAETTARAEFYSASATLKDTLRTKFAEIDKNTSFTVSYDTENRKLIFIDQNDTENTENIILDLANYQEIKSISLNIYTETDGVTSLTGKILKITFTSDLENTSYTFILTSRTTADFVIV